MRIKRFHESIHQDNFENQYYRYAEPWVINRSIEDKFSGTPRKEEWTDGEIRRISHSIENIVDLDKTWNIRHGGSPRYCKGVYRAASDGTPLEIERQTPIYKDLTTNIVCIPTHTFTFFIEKYDDEYFIIKPTLNYGRMGSNDVKRWWYECDGIDGLIKCLKDIL
jgi:hypothetical protein